MTYRKIISLILFLLVGCQLPQRQAETKHLQTPEELYGRLFYDVQERKDLFPDSKTFVDCVPLYDVHSILERYSRLDDRTDRDVLINFLWENFSIPDDEINYISDSSSINDHIRILWEQLKRPADFHHKGTLIPLRHPYIVPGGRFREMYYWDSYFTMLGLQTDGQHELIQNIVDNFCYLIDTLGHIPNGNRTYYMTRSQPPFFSLMVTMLAGIYGDGIYPMYREYLEKEYAFWMHGSEKLGKGKSTYQRVVLLKGGEILNRYWDNANTPRAESYREDVNTAKEAELKIPGTKTKEVYRNLRAAAESGWDFSGRWLEPGKDSAYPLYSIHTTDIIPVDLNSLLYNLEQTLALACRKGNDPERADLYEKKAGLRKKAILTYCWNENAGYFMDFDFKKNKQTNYFSLAGVYPLYFGMADTLKAIRVAHVIKNRFLKPGGVVTSLYSTRQQWDAPNGWAPLQWICIVGLRRYDEDELAEIIKNRWLRLNEQVYNSTYKILEKYNVEDPQAEGGGGEYPNQDGFGWTNGVYQRLSEE